MWFIYVITNLSNGKRYVGQTVDVRNRWANHRFAPGDCPALHAAIKRYGISKFTFRVVEACDSKHRADDAERGWIRWYRSRSFELGYNITEGGDGVSGWTASKETRERMSRAHLGNKSHSGRVFSEEHRARISAAGRGRRMSPQAVAKMRENRRKQSPPMLGRRHSEETKSKMRQSAFARSTASLLVAAVGRWARASGAVPC